MRNKLSILILLIGITVQSFAQNSVTTQNKQPYYLTGKDYKCQLIADVHIDNDYNKDFANLEVVRSLNILVFLVNIPNAPSLSFTADDIKKKLTNENSSINNYLKEVSDGICYIKNIYVFGWYDGATFDVNDLKTKEDIARVNNIDLSTIDHICFLENDPNSGYGGWASMGKSIWKYGSVGISHVFVRKYILDEILKPELFGDFSKIFLHELGHNFNFAHSSTAYHDNDTVKFTQYGDEFDIMGMNTELNGHYRGFLKEAVGWLDSTSISLIEKNGTYKIKALESKFGKRLAKIKVGNPQQPKYFYVEFRNGNGFDKGIKKYPSNLQGLFLYASSQYFGVNSSPSFPIQMTWLLDASSDGNFKEVTLNGNNTFQDKYNCFSIGPIKEITDTTITFEYKSFDNLLVNPIIIAPFNRTIFPNPIEFSWTSIPTANKYEIQIGSPSGWPFYNFLNIETEIQNFVTDSTHLKIELHSKQTSSEFYWLWYWRVRAVDKNGIKSLWSDANSFLQYNIPVNVDAPLEIVSTYKLDQNYPNPFNPTTTIKYAIPKASFVTLQVFDVLGREITKLVNEEKQPGYYEVKCDVKTLHGASLPSGVYFYRITAGDPSAGSGQSFVDTKKFILMK